MRRAIVFLLGIFVTFTLLAPLTYADSANGTTFSIQKTAAPTTVSPNAIVAYSIAITNISGSNAAPQTIVDTLPAGFTYSGNGKLTTVSGQQVAFEPTVSGSTLTWNFDGDTLQSIPPDQNIVVSYQVKVSGTVGSYTNRACLTQPENICASQTINVAVNPNTALPSNVILAVLIGAVLVVVGLSIPTTKKSFEESVLTNEK